MQYLLSEDEMAKVRQEREDARKLPNLVGLINVVQHVATTMIATAEVNGACRPEGEPHGCIHVEDPRGEPYQTRYCDYCQVAGICPQPKEYSK